MPLPCDAICVSPTVSCEPVIFTQEGVLASIDRLSPSSAPGDDDICPKILKITRTISSHLLSLIFSQSVEQMYLPADWRFGKVLPIFKSGDRKSICNYRPISLTSIPCKIMEHITYSHVINYLCDHHLICTNQHGFRKGFSCETQLFEFVTNLHENIHSSKTTDAIFIDFAKAFDTVPHQRLLYKLTQFNIHPVIIQWIATFLVNRKQATSVGEGKSSKLPVKSGVPQGSVLGPLLFLIYINDLPLNLTSSIRLFADDCVIYRRITDTDDQALLQQDLNIISLWCNTWQLEINLNKTKFISFACRPSQTLRKYTLNRVDIEKVKTYKYLGVTFAEDLTWNEHINNTVSSACKALGYIKRNLFRSSREVKLIAYKTFVRSKLEYANIIWCPHQAYLLDKLESVQNKASRYITHDYSRTSSVTAIKKNLDLRLLTDRTKVARLSLFHSIYHSSSEFRNVHLQEPSYISKRLDHPLKVQPPFSRTNKIQNSPLFRAISDWNALPTQIVLERDFKKFRDLCKLLL